MDAFEQLAADILWAEGYWVRPTIKVDLERDHKIAIGKPSSPRWEVDIVAYSAARNELEVLECKSYLDSGGVHAAHLDPAHRLAGRYKLFNDDNLRDTILSCLKDQFVKAGLCPPDVMVKFGLIYGHATRFNEERLQALFAERKWLLRGPEWLGKHLDRMVHSGYENSTAAVVAKLIYARGGGARPRRRTPPPSGLLPVPEQENV